jgi:dUTPase
MTLKILVKTPGCLPLDLDKGDWFDLFLAEDVKLKAPQANKLHKFNQNKSTPEVRVRDVDFDSCIARLGIAVQIPKGYEVNIVPRSSTFKKYGILQTNHFGIVDVSYCGENDEWGMPMVATRTITIPKGTRIAQFRVNLSQKATIWQKIKWLFSSGVKLEAVDTLDNPDRKGFGSTGN